MDTLNISGISNYAADLAASSATDELKQRAKNAQTDEELMEACKEFESYLWEQVVKSMKATIKLTGDEDESESQMVDYFMDNTISEVSKQLTEQNIGEGSLAQQMYEQMKRYSTNIAVSTESESDGE